MNKFAIALLVGTASLVAACGKQEAPPAGDAAATVAPAPEPAAAPAAEPAPTVAAAPANEAGEKVYKNTCSMCHASGAAGAPIKGNKADWAPRIAQGNDILYKHAIEGFTGAKGVMLPRGGAASLSDDDVKAAVDYMVAQSQ